MSISITKEECGENLSQGISEGSIANVKKGGEIKDEPLEVDMMVVGVNKEFEEEGNGKNRNVEIEDIKVNKKPGESSNFTNVKKDVEIMDEPLEDDMIVHDDEEGKDTNRTIKIKEGITVNKDSGKSNDIHKDIQKSMNEDVEVMVRQNEINVEPVLNTNEEGTNDSTESESESIGSESEEKDYVKAIRKSLGIVARPGTFACGGVLENARLQLHVEGVGKIKFPLSFKQGEVLKSKCTAAPFGQGSKTLHSKTVRDAWQIDAKDVTLDKKFIKLVKEKVSEIIPTLMGKSVAEVPGIKHELYKLVYYEKGGHFKAHRDTEKAPGMFATLVIQLPAPHQGGTLVVRHKGETKVFDFDEDGSNDEFFFTAFFADCEHELRNIISGHRLVLIYNLIRKNPHLMYTNNYIKPSKNEKFMTIMRESVEKWKSDKGPRYMALKLDHLYTNINTSFKHLKGRDTIIADALCSCTDIEVYIATIIKTVKRMGYEDDPNPYGDKPDLIPEGEVETVCSYTLHNLMDVNNKKTPFGGLDLHTNGMLIKEEHMFEKYEEEFNSEVEYTGNEGCHINYFYKKKALVFWPKKNSKTKKTVSQKRKRVH